MENEEWSILTGKELAEQCDWDIVVINQVFRAALTATLDTLRSKGVINPKLTVTDLVDPLLINPKVRH
jgi:hypothetical protein